MNKSLFSILLFLHVFFLATSIARPTPRKLDTPGYPWPFDRSLPINNASSPFIQEYGSYAVSEYNNKTTAHLEFIKVVNGTILIYDMQHRESYVLWVEAKNCTNPDQSDIYETQVNHQCYGVRGSNPYIYCYRYFDYLKKLG